ncbi:DNA methyltransferase [Brachyspira hyodysenteriae]|nr:DNA methyltransferase [Brachyspira hyodysenteriae]MDA0001669.1 DNA methyltransferase [Brachyspira hyodysenteriae]
MPADQKNNYVNKLFYGDNLDVMNEKIPNNSIDLIYLDPPFNSNRNYNMIYTTNTGQPVPEGAIAFCDAWELTEDKLDEVQEFANELETEDDNAYFADFWNAWVKALKYQNPKILAYLVFMARRLRVMRYKLKDTGSLFLHCDQTASHYIKIILDGIFGHKNFRNFMSEYAV